MTSIAPITTELKPCTPAAEKCGDGHALYAGPARASAAAVLRIFNLLLPRDDLVGVPNAPVLADVDRLRKTEESAKWHV